MILLPIDVPGVRDLLADKPGESDYAALYRNLATHCGPNLAAVVTVVAEHVKEPVIVGCSLGKDRTGVVMALLLSLLEVPLPLILEADRAARAALGACLVSTTRYARLRRITQSELRRRLALGTSAVGDLLITIAESHKDTEGFLRAHGVTSETIAALRIRLTARPPYHIPGRRPPR